MALHLLASVVTGGVLVWLSERALTGQAASAELLLLACVAFVPYGLLLLVRPPPGRWGLWTPLLLAALTGAALLRAPPSLSDDVYRYLWDGRVLLHGVDPYAHAPSDLALWDLRDEHWSRINHRELATIYPPGAQGLFALGYLATQSPLGMKGLALLLHLITAALIFRVAPRLSAEPARAASLYALNPLALLETALAGHVDVAVGALVLLSAVLLLRSSLALAATAIVATASIKLVGLPLVPLLWMRSRRLALLAGLGCILCLLPVLGAGHGSPGEVQGIRHYATRWQGNGSAHAVLQSSLTVALNLLPAGSPRPDGPGPEELELTALRPLLSALAHTPFDPRAPPLVERKPARDPAIFYRPYLAGLLAKGMAAALWCGLLVWLLRRRCPPAVAVRWLVLALLLLAPQVHPWYLLWLLPLELSLGRRVALVWSAAVLAAYAPLDMWAQQREWLPPAGAQVVQYALVYGALAWELWAATRPDSSVDPARGPV